MKSYLDTTTTMMMMMTSMAPSTVSAAAVVVQARGVTGSAGKRVGGPSLASSKTKKRGGGVVAHMAAAGGRGDSSNANATLRRGTAQRVAAAPRDVDDVAEPMMYSDDDFAQAMFDDDDEYPGMSSSTASSRTRSSASSSSSPSFAMAEDAVSITPDQRRAAVQNRSHGDGGGGSGEDYDYDGFGDNRDNNRNDDYSRGGRGGDNDNGWNSAAAATDTQRSRGGSSAGSGSSSGGVGWANDDIISDGGQAWFESDEDWYEPEYKEVTAPEGSVLEKVQRIHLRQPKDFSFEDGEYFDLTGYVKDNTDNQFCAVLEVAERARERKIEQLEALNPIPPGASLPPIQQAIVDLALEIEASGGKTSAYLAMKEAADRTRLRWELQEAAWAWDNYCEEYMPQLGVSERASRLLHMGMRVEDAMDFEKDLVVHEEDYNKRF